MLTGKTILITGGTGSLGKILVRHLLTGEPGLPQKIYIFSRDEAKIRFSPDTGIKNGLREYMKWFMKDASPSA